MDESGISVVICCHNSADRLPETLAHIAVQQLQDGISGEVVIVDNASSDDTAGKAIVLWRNLAPAFPIRVVPEPRIGLSYARETGFSTARYPFIVFSDDDNWLRPDYLRIAYHIMNNHPEIGVLGGCGEPVFAHEPPSWLKRLRLFAVGPQAPVSGRVPAQVVYGAGFIIRKSAYQRIREAGFSSLLPDRMAKNLSSGGDYELCYITAMAGYEIWYEETLRFRHYFTADRLTWEYYIKYIRESYRCFEVLEPLKILVSGPDLMNWGYITFRLARNFFYFIRKFILTFFRGLLYSPQSEKGRISRLNSKVYLIMVVAYIRDYRRLMGNYRKCLELKRRLKEGFPGK